MLTLESTEPLHNGHIHRALNKKVRSVFNPCFQRAACSGHVPSTCTPSRLLPRPMLWCVLSLCNTHTMETELRCSSDICTRLPLVTPAPPPRATPHIFFQAGSLGVNAILSWRSNGIFFRARTRLLRGRGPRFSAWAWARSAHGRERDLLRVVRT